MLRLCLKAHVFLVLILRLYIEHIHQKSIIIYASVYGIKQEKKINKTIEKS